MNNAYIQIQDITGRWITIDTVKNNDLSIKIGLDNKAFMKKRLRAVDSNNRVIDIR